MLQVQTIGFHSPFIQLFDHLLGADEILYLSIRKILLVFVKLIIWMFYLAHLFHFCTCDSIVLPTAISILSSNNNIRFEFCQFILWFFIFLPLIPLIMNICNGPISLYNPLLSDRSDRMDVII